MKNQEMDWLLAEKYRGEKSAAFFADCARLEAGELLAYIIGSIPFLDCQIHLDSHPLIPRPETEYWVEQAIIDMQTTIRRAGESRGWTPKILDLCAGSGAIGVAVAKAVPEAHVAFAEIDPTHLLTIQTNLHQNLSTESKVLFEQYMVVASDLFENVTDTFDYILTNPPYIDSAANTVETSVTTHEPHLALFGGAGGMEIIERIIATAKVHLTPETGQLWIEHEPFQRTAILQLAAIYGYHSNTYPDQYGTDRYSVLIPVMAE